jgi:conjugative relaxase-like TrwC/TraI family protein
LALRLETLGYELERGNHGQPEVKGYTKEYLEASSPRRGQIKDHLREQGIYGAAAAQIAAHHTRDRKREVIPRKVLPTTRSEVSCTVAFKEKTSTTPSIMRCRASARGV